MNTPTRTSRRTAPPGWTATLVAFVAAVFFAPAVGAEVPDDIDEDPDDFDTAAEVEEADEREPTEDERRRANERFEQGAEHFFNEEYGRAIVEFRRALQLNPHPMILYNKSLAHIRLGNPESGYETALEARQMDEDLPADQMVRNDARLRATGTVLTGRAVGADVADLLEERREQHQRASERAVVDADEVGAGVQTRGQIVARAVEALVDPEVDPEPDPDPPEVDPPAERPVADGSTLGTTGWIGVVTTAAGAGLLGYAGLLEYQLEGQIEDYERASEEGDQARFDELRTDIEQTTRRGQIALYSGAGLAATGLTLVMIGAFSSDAPAETTDTRVRLSPAADADGPAGIFEITGRF